jgi:tetratricopeptide (TPR) repeat protein
MRLSYTHGWRRLPWLLVLMLLLTFGLFSKESSIALVGVIVAYDLVYQWELPKSKILGDWVDSFVGAMGRFFVRVYVVLIPPMLMMFFVRRWVFENATPPEEPFLDNPIRGAGFFQGRMTAIKVIGKLLWRLVWPQSLSADYSYNQVPIFHWNSTPLEDAKAIIALLVVVGLIVFAFWNWKRNKGLAFWIFFFFIALMPTANLIIVIGSIMAERFVYLPLAGFCMVVVMVINWALHKLIIDRKDPQPTGEGGPLTFLPHVVICGIMIAFGVRTAYRNLDWRSDNTLFTAGVEECPNAFRNYQSLAFALYTEDQRGNIDRCIDLAEKGLAILDDLPPQLNSSRLYLHLGMYYSTKAQTLFKPENNTLVVTPEARGYLEKAVKVLERGKKMDEAFNKGNHEKELRRGRQDYAIPNAGLPQLYTFLGDAQRLLGHFPEALDAYNYARNLDPRDAETYLKLADLYLQIGKQDDAIQKMIQLLILKPTQMQVWNVLGNILNRDGAQRIIVDPKTKQPLFNSNDMKVKELILDADREFVRFLLETHRPQLAQSARDVAVNQHGFAPNLIDPLFEGSHVSPTPVKGK